METRKKSFLIQAKGRKWVRKVSWAREEKWRSPTIKWTYFKYSTNNAYNILKISTSIRWYIASEILRASEEKKTELEGCFYSQKQYFQFLMNIGGFVFLMTLNCNLSVTNKIWDKCLSFLLEMESILSDYDIYCFAKTIQQINYKISTFWTLKAA